MKNKKLYIAFTLLCLFMVNSILVMNGAYTKVDAFVHDKVILMYSEVMDKVMRIITFFGSTVFIIALAAVLLVVFFVLKKRNKGICAVGLLGVSTVANVLVKNIIRRPRPEYITVIEKSFSYPSGHTMASTTVYGFLIYLVLNSNLNKKEKTVVSILLGTLIFLVGLSRIFLGAHFFSDVFGGVILSALVLLVFTMFDDAKHIIKK